MADPNREDKNKNINQPLIEGDATKTKSVVRDKPAMPQKRESQPVLNAKGGDVKR